MAKIDMKTDLNVAPDEVWKLIGGFNALPDWHPAIEKSELLIPNEVPNSKIVCGLKWRTIRNSIFAYESCTEVRFEISAILRCIFVEDLSRVPAPRSSILRIR